MVVADELRSYGAVHREVLHVKGAGHYFEGPSHLLTGTVTEMVDWALSV
ncbi:hypothetical protein ACGFNV_02030 [Streptomyces sp. NPDC048751]